MRTYIYVCNILAYIGEGFGGSKGSTPLPKQIINYKIYKKQQKPNEQEWPTY